MSTLRVSTLQDTAGSNSSTPSQIANGIAKAWVNFNGTGTVAIRASYNVSSITDFGTAEYQANFASALVDANYTTQVTASGNTYSGISMYYIVSNTASATRVNAGYMPYSAAGFYDCPTVCVTVHR